MKLGGYFIDAKTGRTQLPMVLNPSTLDVDNVITQFSNKNGVVCMSVEPAPDIGSYELVLYADSGNFLLMLSKYLDDGGHEVDSITNYKAERAMVDILGDYYPANTMTKDISFICNCFKVFLEQGNIPPEFLVIN